MVTAEELTVAIKSTGVDETRGKLEGVEESMNETAESAGNSAEQLSGFSERFAGAMTAAVGALALGAAGLLTQVPVLGEAFSGLRALIDAVAFQMDGVLRPAMSGVTSTLFEVANAIFEADGNIQSLIGQLGIIASSAGLAGGALAALGISLTGPIAIAIATVAAAIGALAVAWETNFADIQGATESYISAIQRRFTSFVNTVEPIVRGFLKRLETFWDNNGDAIISAVNFALRFVLTTFEQVFDALLTVVQAGLQLLTGDFEGAFNTITNFLDRTLSRWKPLFEEVISAIQGLIGPFVNNIIADIERLVEDIGRKLSVLPGVDVGGDVTFGRVGTGGGGGGGTGRARGVGGGSFGGSNNIILDGRKQSEDTGRYRADPGRRRGL